MQPWSPIERAAAAGFLLAWCAVCGGILGWAFWQRGLTFFQAGLFYAAVLYVTVRLVAYLLRKRSERKRP
jgi:hypothetical protein